LGFSDAVVGIEIDDVCNRLCHGAGSERAERDEKGDRAHEEKALVRFHSWAPADREARVSTIGGEPRSSYLCYRIGKRAFSPSRESGRAMCAKSVPCTNRS